MKSLAFPTSLALALLVLQPRPAAAADPLTSPLDGYYGRWLASVSHLIAEDERRTFDQLASDLEREIFIRRFWRARGGDGSGWLERWRENFDAARRRFASFEEDRARALLIAGKPPAVTALRGCREVIRYLEVWSYEPWHAAYATGTAPGGGGAQGFRLLFVRDSNLERGVYRHWSRRDGTAPLIYGGHDRVASGREPWTAAQLVDYATAHGCFDRAGDAEVLAAALDAALDVAELRHRLAAPAPDPGWLDELSAAGTATLPAAPAELLLPGRYQTKTVLHGRILVPAREVAANAEGLLFDRLTVHGDLRLGGADGRLVDVFEVVHHVAGTAPADGLLTLDFYRRLRHGTYTLNLRAEDAHGRGLLREVRTVEVPRLEAAAEPPAGRRNGFAALTRGRVGVLTTFPSVELLPPADDLPVGEVEIVAVTAGGPIERVDFLLDGEAAGSDDEPPFAVELDLGSEPRRRTVAAVAFDPAGRQIAGDELELVPGSRRFAVHLVEPRRGSAGDRARAVVEVPAGEVLDRLELYLNQRRFATLHAPPFHHPLPPVDRSGSRAVFVRAVAYLENGAATEDVTVVTSPDPLEEIDVQLIELYTTVVDARGRPVTGLAAEELRVLEDGEEQPIRRFATVENLAINVALVMDVSGSMRGRVRMATESAQRFFDTVLTDRDLATLLTFNHDIRRVVPFTADAERLRYGADGFRAFGTTRLHDSLIYTVHSFGGLTGKRALVLLSDGQDVDSDFRFKQVLESTLRSGIAVYPIMLDLDDEETRANLVELAGETGGSYFSIHGVGELDRVYRRIERELRSQYLLVYEAPAGGRGDFRRIEVEVLRDGVEAKTIRGYYP